MRIGLVTITGADDRTDISDMIEISREYPFVEWGILFSANPVKTGSPRYPSLKWLAGLKARFMELQKDDRAFGMKISAHLCGGYTKEMVECGSSNLLHHNMQMALSPRWFFNRMQLNFNASKLTVDKGRFLGFVELCTRVNNDHLILQYNDSNKELCEYICEKLSIQNIRFLNFLHDASGGIGLSPKEWKSPIEGYFTGYAGGLSPDNLTEELKKIEAVAGDNSIWIDAETGLRTDDVLDLDKVRRFLEIAKPYYTDLKSKYVKS